MTLDTYFLANQCRIKIKDKVKNISHKLPPEEESFHKYLRLEEFLL